MCDEGGKERVFSAVGIMGDGDFGMTHSISGGFGGWVQKVVLLNGGGGWRKT